MKRSLYSLTLSITLAVLVSGCGSSGESELGQRLEAAAALDGTMNRDAALEKLAIDAAQAGDVTIVKKCLGKISGTMTKDKTAYDAAMALGKAGKVDAARDVAQSIAASIQKEEALSRIAKGEYGK